jgi:hypothetical protein
LFRRPPRTQSGTARQVGGPPLSRVSPLPFAPDGAFGAMLSHMDTAHGSVEIEDVTPEEVENPVSDVTRTGEWSPENTDRLTHV